MIRTQIIRCISTRSIVDKWFNAFESKTHEEQQAKLGQCIEYSLQQEQWNYFNLIRDIIHRWVIEQPKTEALWTYETDSHNCQKLTFNDIYTQSSSLADVLTGSQFNLTAGKSVSKLKSLNESNFYYLNRYWLFYHVRQKNEY
jgi:hypothetical protein